MQNDVSNGESNRKKNLNSDDWKIVAEYMAVVAIAGFLATISIFA